MAKVSTSISLDADVKAKAQELFADFGMDLSTAINIFLRQSIRESRIPFVIQREEPNAVTIAAMEAAENDEDLYGPFDNVADLMEALNAGQFKRDYKLAVKRGCDPKKMETVISMLCNEGTLPESYRDHALTNSRNYKDMRECHIQPDWLLVYKIVNERLILKLIRTGTHSDLF